jgi:hypothetical protein
MTIQSKLCKSICNTPIERIKVRQISKHHVICIKKCQNTNISPPKEQPHIHCLAAYGILVIRQYEGKSYRLFSEWLVEAYYLRMFLQLSHIPHFTTLLKFTERVNDTMLERIISSFIVLTNIRLIFVGIDSSGFKATHASQYYAERANEEKKKKIH